MDTKKTAHYDIRFPARALENTAIRLILDHDFGTAVDDFKLAAMAREAGSIRLNPGVAHIESTTATPAQIRQLESLLREMKVAFDVRSGEDERIFRPGTAVMKRPLSHWPQVEDYA